MRERQPTPQDQPFFDRVLDRALPVLDRAAPGPRYMTFGLILIGLSELSKEQALRQAGATIFTLGLFETLHGVVLRR